MTEPSPGDRMAGMITGYWASQMVHVAARLGLADLLADGPRTADELARSTGTHSGSLYRLLRALASVGVFSEGEGRRFSLSNDRKVKVRKLTFLSEIGPDPAPNVASPRTANS